MSVLCFEHTGCVVVDIADLNLRVDEAGTKGTPISTEAFAFMWAGVRASFGVTKGKVCFEVKVCISHSLPGLWWCLWIESEGMYQTQFTCVMVVLVDRK